MNINQLKYFVIVAECGSINKAAQKLFISQPHLSNIIKKLEKTNGFELFIRTYRGVSLTPNGEYFLIHAKTILQEIERLKQFTAANINLSDNLRVSMTKFNHIMEAFNEVTSKNNNLDEFTFILNEGSTSDVIKDLANGYTDVGVVHYNIHEANNIHDLIEKNGLSWNIIGELEPEIILSRNHELFRKEKKISLENLENYGFVRYLGKHEDFIYNIIKNGYYIDLNISNKIIYVYGRATLLNLISTSNFYTIGIKELENKNSNLDIISIPIEGCESRILFTLITRDNTPISPITEEFIHNVTDRLNKLNEHSMSTNSYIK